MSKPLIILDSGHNEYVQGKQAPDGSMREWEFNNNIQYKLKPRLEALGFEVYLTNPAPAKKNEIGLSARAIAANNYWIGKGKPNALFISLHANAYGAWTNANGVEVFHAMNASSKSKNAAKIMCKHIHNTLKTLRADSVNRGVKSENFTVIFKASMPSILVEYGFYTNRGDLAILKNNREELAEATVKAICEYFNVKYNKTVSAQPIQSKPSDSFKVKVLVDELNIRKDASAKATIVGQVNSGEVFTIVEARGVWGRLKSNAGWINISSKYCKKI